MALLLITHLPPPESYVLGVRTQYRLNIKMTILAFPQQNVNVELLLIRIIPTS